MTNPPCSAVPPVIVAVDGSPESANALRWAAAWANRTACELRVITCYRHRQVVGEASGISWGHFESSKRSAKERALDVIVSVLGAAPVDHVMALGPVEAVLIDHGRDAAMIVLGTRSSFDLQASSQPSTTDKLTGKVRCPVVSIPLDAAVLQGVQ